MDEQNGPPGWLATVAIGYFIVGPIVTLIGFGVYKLFGWLF